jgi:hypothetical protein
MVDHVFGKKDGAPALTDRLCRRGARFGPASVEESMGVLTVFHEEVALRSGAPGKLRCLTCGEVDAS